MIRWGLVTLTSKKRRKAEIKNTKVKYNDLVTRNYNSKIDNIISTDVSYIPATAIHNHIYLSVAISHKTKKIELWKISENDDIKLIFVTLDELDRKGFILHSDHGFQYSSYEVTKKVEEMNSQISMIRIGN
ncbi:integrase catalytic domain-containing protein [Mesoplasma corruscae]|uniref:Transposase n=1 Tax=Mesoplasma corruscae TaxID=216874 RepID=A0A2S5RGB9_9MOLU|nr:DDE-type integrase/transposase/recombinase [Mesoplasma corruscae]PPE06376.1 transposase [Mesoplasma corruscae]